MTDYPGGRRNRPDDPTDERASDPVPTGDDVVNRHRRGHDTPRQYEEPVDRSESGQAHGTHRARPVVRDLGSE